MFYSSAQAFLSCSEITIFITNQIELITKSDLSISTQGAIQTLGTDATKNHMTIVEEMQTMGMQVSQSMGTELEQKLPLLEDNLS